MDKFGPSKAKLGQTIALVMSDLLSVLKTAAATVRIDRLVLRIGSNSAAFGRTGRAGQRRYDENWFRFAGHLLRSAQFRTVGLVPVSGEHGRPLGFSSMSGSLRVGPVRFAVSTGLL